MRTAIVIAAFGLVLGAPMIAPTGMMSQAQAMQGMPENQTLTPPDPLGQSGQQQERALEAQLVALAQAGNTGAIQQLIQAQVNAGNSAMLARIARRVATMGGSLAGTDTRTAAALSTAAILIASNSSVAAADTTVESDVGGTTAQTAATLTNTDPVSSASIQQTAAVAGSSNLVASFMTGGSNTQTATVGGEQGGTQQTGSTTTTTRRTNTPLVVTPTTTTTVEVPIVPEPNPGQLVGSPT